MGCTADPRSNPWANDRQTLDLYRRRCRRLAEEMTCAAQAATLLQTRVTPGETLLDAGCGGGYYYWSFSDRGIPVEYYGIDYTPEMIDLARTEMCRQTGLSPDRFMLGGIEHLDSEFDNVICFNVLTNNPHYGVGLERLLACARKRILLRESLGDCLAVRFTPDPYLDPDKRHIRVYHNTYPLAEVKRFMEENGFAVTQVRDERSGDGVEMVVDIPHYWKVLIGERRT
jgi:ubiquinone/menaquinone biosynthesis C-methylase UbiE